MFSPVFGEGSGCASCFVSPLCVRQLEGDLFRSGEGEVRSAVSSGVIARQDELCDVKRVLETRTNVSVPSAPSPYKEEEE